MRTGSPWYRSYATLEPQVRELRERFVDRCRALGASPQLAFNEVSRELIARAVHESNWQEGEYLSAPRTRELSDEALESLPPITGPHLDLDAIVESHKKSVAGRLRRGATREEIAAFNLSVAHHLLGPIATELAFRQAASMAQVLARVVDLPSRTDVDSDVARTKAEEFEAVRRRGKELLGTLLASRGIVYGRLDVRVQTEGELLAALMSVPFDDLLHPMRVAYVQALHRIALMGILPPRQLGHFRSKAVHVGSSKVMFPPAILVPGMMEEFVHDFPTILPTTAKYDGILRAAGVSHRFVAIHPFADGNGRVSRLIMNLIVTQHVDPPHPPVYLKADKKGRHRYITALVHADRGDFEPLGCLIAMALIEAYSRLLAAAGSPWHLERGYVPNDAAGGPFPD